MKDFIVYEGAEGSFHYVRRADISSFRAQYISKFKYHILATVGPIQLIVADVESPQKAKEWILNEISLLEKAPTEPISKPVK